jgi:hypothetical protein
MYKVEIDTKGVIDQLGDSAYMVLDKAVDILGEVAMDHIQRLAGDKISNVETRTEYMKACGKPKREGTYIVIEITDPKMIGIEEGFGGFDIKPGMLTGPKVKHGENGPYQDVPFEHKVTKRGKGTFVEAKGMRSMVKKAMAEVKVSGETKRVFPQQKGFAATKLSDMKIAPSSTAQGVSAKTFRRVSEKSAEDSWLHPGLEGIKVFEEASKLLEDQAMDIVRDIAEGLK